jgi:hypothetical protein
VKIFLGNRVLAGGIDEEQEPFDMQLEVSGQVQVILALRAECGRPIDRGNRTVELRFFVMRRHPSACAATEFLLSHGSSLKDLEGTATVVVESPSQSIFYIPSAVLRRVQGVQDGPHTTHGYVILGDQLTTVNPQGA